LQNPVPDCEHDAPQDRVMRYNSRILRGAR
jgi:hypothetical protein